MNLFGGFGLMFSIFPIFFLFVSALVTGIFVFFIVKVISRHRQDSTAPRLTSEAEVVSKRTHIWGDHSHTDYYVTFQFPSGDRVELNVPYDRVGYLVEGDKGKLTFQGTRFLGFERT